MFEPSENVESGGCARVAGVNKEMHVQSSEWAEAYLHCCGLPMPFETLKTTPSRLLGFGCHGTSSSCCALQPTILCTKWCMCLHRIAGLGLAFWFYIPICRKGDVVNEHIYEAACYWITSLICLIQYCLVNKVTAKLRGLGWWSSMSPSTWDPLVRNAEIWIWDLLHAEHIHCQVYCVPENVVMATNLEMVLKGG